jgi:hypothetical protein
LTADAAERTFDTTDETDQADTTTVGDTAAVAWWDVGEGPLRVLQSKVDPSVIRLVQCRQVHTNQGLVELSLISRILGIATQR